MTDAEESMSYCIDGLRHGIKLRNDMINFLLTDCKDDEQMQWAMLDIIKSILTKEATDFLTLCDRAERGFK